MNAENNITTKSVSLDDERLLLVIYGAVIYGAMGNPWPEKVLAVIESYKNSNNSIIGVLIDNILVGVLGLRKTNEVITVRLISVLIDYQKQGVGTLLLKEVKKQYEGCKIVAETDTESVYFLIHND